MRTRLIVTAIALAISAFLVGCAGKTKFPSYYTLHVPPAPDPPIVRGTRASVAVREFRSPAYLRQGAIVYRPSAEQIGFYNYQRWAVNPRAFVTNAIVDRLRASGRFSEVKFYDGHTDFDYLLSGELEKLEEVDYDGGVKVEVALSAQMTDLRSGKAVWANDASDVAGVDKRTVPAVVADMSQSMDRAIQKLVDSLPSLTTTSAEPPKN